MWSHVSNVQPPDRCSSVVKRVGLGCSTSDNHPFTYCMQCVWRINDLKIVLSSWIVLGFFNISITRSRPFMLHHIDTCVDGLKNALPVWIVQDFNFVLKWTVHKVLSIHIVPERKAKTPRTKKRQVRRVNSRRRFNFGYTMTSCCAIISPN